MRVILGQMCDNNLIYFIAHVAIPLLAGTLEIFIDWLFLAEFPGLLMGDLLGIA